MILLSHNDYFTVKFLGYEEENKIYERVIVERKETNSLEWISEAKNLKNFLKNIDEDDFTDTEKREAMRIGLFEAL